MTDLEYLARNLKSWPSRPDILVARDLDSFIDVEPRYAHKYPLYNWFTRQQWLEERKRLGFTVPVPHLDWLIENVTESDWPQKAKSITKQDGRAVFSQQFENTEYWFTKNQWQNAKRLHTEQTTFKPTQPKPMTSTQLLDACKAVQEQRGSEYQKEAERSFQTVAEAFNTITGKDLKPSDVTFLLVLLKAVRQYTNPDRLHEDSVLDLISYSSLWGEELYKEHSK